MKTHSRLVLATAFALVAACGAKSPPEPAASAPPPALAETAAPATAARDVPALKACEIVKPEEVATIVGGKLLNEPPAGFPNCAYVLDVNGATESYRITFADPGVYTAMLEMQGEDERGEKLDGLWDEAYVQPRAMGDGVSVIVIKRGDIALEASGPRKEPAVEIARLAVSQIQ